MSCILCTVVVLRRVMSVSTLFYSTDDNLLQPDTGVDSALRFVRSGREGVADLAQGAAERGLELHWNHQMALSCKEAEGARPRVVGDQRRQRVIRALDQLRRSPVFQAAAAFRHVAEEPPNGRGQLVSAVSLQELLELLDAVALLQSRQHAALAQLPDDVRAFFGVYLQHQRI